MLTTEEALELMTVEQMMMTRKRQVSFELEEHGLSPEKEKDLGAEYWALQNMINENMGEDLLPDTLENLRGRIGQS